MPQQKKLSEEDQARVDQFLKSGYNRTEKKPYRPLMLLLVLWVVVTLLGAAAYWLTKSAGIL
jgi:hypothetical protein